MDDQRSKRAAAIPNLLDTLRSAKASRNTRNAAQQPSRSEPQGFSSNPISAMSHPQHETPIARRDRIVQQTDDDAAGSRQSAVEAGYLHDPFARMLYLDSTHRGGGAGQQAPEGVLQVRRMPIINRGK